MRLVQDNAHAHGTCACAYTEASGEGEAQPPASCLGPKDQAVQGPAGTGSTDANAGVHKVLRNAEPV